MSDMKGLEELKTERQKQNDEQEVLLQKDVHHSESEDSYKQQY